MKRDTMKYRYALTLILCITSCAATAESAVPLSDWPEFRGPTGQGIAENATPPLEWSQGKNILWKREIPGKGWSSPVVYDDSVYLTTAIEDGQDNILSLHAIRIDADTGDILWDEEVFHRSNQSKKHTKNGYASPTPIVADGRVYVHFGPMGTACLDTEGKVLWRQTGLAYETPHGSGGSPILYGGKLIFSCDATDTPFIVALDQSTGKVAWRTERETQASKKFSFSTPLLIDDHGRKLVVSAGSGMVGAYDVNDGTEVWHVRYGEGFSVVPRPVLAHGLIFIATGFVRPCRVYAIRTGGQGDVSDTHVAWTSTESAPHTPSMLAVDDELYFLSDRGEFSCVDAVTGRVHWRERVGGRFSASPVYANNRIYATNEDGVTVVVQAGKKFQLLAENALEERTFASPALCGQALFIRSEHSLYRIEER
jgi:outer membrane protein assembly factor BamB